MINVPLATNTDNKNFRQTIERKFDPALEQFKPQIIFISADFDAHAEDPLAQLELIEKNYV
jgi:Deacetylases, including yeast histone deacetylase and acetoin utilization protein